MDERVWREAAERFGTPLYVYGLEAVRERAAELRAALPASAGLLYSLKANPLPAVAAEVRAAGCRAEVSSAGELRAALEAGFAADGILYTGPGKSAAEIAGALECGVALFSCESATELRRLGRVAGAAGRRAGALLRLQPVGGPAAGLSMADGRQFGFDPADAVRACAAVPDAVSVRGCHVYLGSQISGVEALLEGFASAKRTVEHVCREAGLVPEIVDLGGGFPWPYATPGTGGGFQGLAEGLGELLGHWEFEGPAPEVWFESGRRPIAEAGSLLTTVVDVKVRPDGATTVVVDAGVNVLGGMTGLGRVLRPSTGFENLSAGTSRHDPDGPGGPEAAGTGGRGGPVLTAAVVGPLCTPLDRLAVRAEIADPRVGDLLRVPNVGAYGPTASLSAFLSRPPAVEAVYDGDRLVGAWQLAAGHVAAG
ncbi:type III PLP-dependent enzyme [Streptomyces sp. cmx-4-9]|uniref:type III PLP-dependent enzyme n=1 Tax=Streptomyces sp. cmx-4-9 TaxID=2790941 RepID=UPI00397FAA97